MSGLLLFILHRDRIVLNIESTIVLAFNMAVAFIALITRTG